jgi:hypothetical protein
MPVLSVRVTEEGVSVPEGLVRDPGLEPGGKALVEVRKAPEAATIAALAKHCARRSLGDALAWGSRSGMVSSGERRRSSPAALTELSAARASVRRDRSLLSAQWTPESTISSPSDPRRFL